MAKKDQFSKEAGNEYEKTAASSLPDAHPKALIRKKTGGKMELVNNPKKRTSVRKNATYAPKANAVASKASRPNKSNLASRIDDSISLPKTGKTADNNNSIVRSGNSFNKNTIPIAALSFSCFLFIFVLLFCIIPLKKISYEVPIVYQDIEFYTEQEPYLDTIYYSEQEPYTVSEAYVVREPYTVTEPYIVYQQRPTPSPWPVSFPPPPTNNHTRPHPFPPTPQPTVDYRQVTRYMDVTKYRDIVQYKDVQKTRNEINYRPVQKQRLVTKVRQETRYMMVPILYYSIPS